MLLRSPKKTTEMCRPIPVQSKQAGTVHIANRASNGIRDIDPCRVQNHKIGVWSSTHHPIYNMCTSAHPRQCLVHGILLLCVSTDLKVLAPLHTPQRLCQIHCAQYGYHPDMSYPTHKKHAGECRIAPLPPPPFGQYLLAVIRHSQTHPCLRLRNGW
jgi:hypothetical protein